MIKKVLFLNDKIPFSEDLFKHISNIEVSWVQHESVATDLEEILEAHKEIHILIARYLDLNANNLQKLLQLELIITMTTSTTFIDKTYCQKNAIKIRNTPKFAGPAVAEHAVAMLLTASKNIIPLNARIARKDFYAFAAPSIELFQKKAGIIGFGDIGQRVASILRGLGMKVCYYRRTKIESELGKQVDLDTLLSESDVTFLTLPLNADSQHILDSEAFSKMKYGSILINVCPEKLVEFNALKEALETGKLAYACLDLMRPDDRYQFLPNLITTPCRAWNTKETDERRAKTFTATLADYIQEWKENNNTNGTI